MTVSKRSRQIGDAWNKLTGKRSSGTAFDGFLDALATRGEAPVGDSSRDLLSTWPFCLAGQIPYASYFLLLHIIAKPGERIRIDANGDPLASELAYFEQAGLSIGEVHAGIERLRSEGILSSASLDFEGIAKCHWLRVRHPEESTSN